MTEPDGIAEQLADAPHTHEDRNNKRARKGRASRPGSRTASPTRHRHRSPAGQSPARRASARPAGPQPRLERTVGRGRGDGHRGRFDRAVARRPANALAHHARDRHRDLGGAGRTGPAARRSRPGWLWADVRTPAALTGSVATAVLGIRLTLLGWTWAGIATLIIAFVLWAALLGPVLGLDQLAVGRGDHRITGGALGISALAAAKIAAVGDALGILEGVALKDIAAGLWVLAMLWLLVLLGAEARWPRLRYDARRWSTVFPLGMYAASSFAVGAVAHDGAITSFARVSAGRTDGVGDRLRRHARPCARGRAPRAPARGGPPSPGR